MRNKAKMWTEATLFSLAAISSCCAPAVAYTFDPLAALRDTELDRIRGGFTTPDGLKISVGIQMDTRVNGELILRSVLVPQQEPVRVYARPVGAPEVPTVKVDVKMPELPKAQDIANLAIERSTMGTVTVSRPSAPQLTVTSLPKLSDAAANTLNPDTDVSFEGGGVAPVLMAVSEQPTETGAGVVSLTTSQNGPVVELVDNALQVRHLLGASTSIVANEANDRVITTSTIVGIALPNANASNLGSMVFRAEDAALAVTRSLIR